MKTLDWYIFRKYLGTFFFSISLLIIIVIVFDVSENIDSFIKNEATFREVVLHYYVPFIPYFINLFIYLFVFISVIFFTSKMAGHTEIIAILSSGVSFKRFLLPYVGAALLLSVGSFYLGNFLIPKTDTVRREFKDKYIEKLTKSSGSNIHVQIEKGVYVYVGNFDIKRKIAYKFTVEKFEDNEMTYKLLADKASYDTITGKWKLDNYVERRLEKEEYLERGKSKDTTLLLKPRDLYNIKEEFEEMKKHIFDLTNKYFVERVLWNTANRHNMPAEDDYRQQFINAENFLIIQGFKKLNELRKDWRKALTEEEISFIESMIKPME